MCHHLLSLGSTLGLSGMMATLWCELSSESRAMCDHVSCYCHILCLFLLRCVGPEEAGFLEGHYCWLLIASVTEPTESS